MAGYSALLRDRVTLAVRSVDRIFLQGYVPHLQTAGWCARFLREPGRAPGQLADAPGTPVIQPA